MLSNLSDNSVLRVRDKKWWGGQ